jgi:type II secretory pathway pseudopilin PulG
MWQVCGVAIAMSSGAVALGQTNSSAGTSLNQMALRNAQQAMQQSFQQSGGGMPGAGRIGLGLDTSYSGTKPFSGFSQGPTVSPYLNLFRVDQNGFQGFNYSTLVAPELQQQQFNQRQQQQNTTTTRRLQAISAQADYNVQGSKEEFPTGHQTVFQYFGHYYPQQRPHQKKKAQ